MVRDAYFGAIEYINYSLHKMMILGQTGVTKFDDSDRAETQKYYNFFLVGSADAIDIFTKLNAKFTKAIMLLTEEALKLQECNGNITLYTQEQEMALKQMKQINSDRKEYNDKKKDIPRLLELYDEQYKQAEEMFEKNIKKLDESHNIKVTLSLCLLNKCVQEISKITPDAYDVVFKLRSELDRKLSKKDTKKIRNSMDYMMEQTREELNVFMESLECRLFELNEKGVRESLNKPCHFSIYSRFVIVRIGRANSRE